MKPQIWLLFTGLLLVTSLQGQKTAADPADSLMQALTRESEDSNKANTMLRLASLYRRTIPAKGFAFAQASLDLSQKVRFQLGMAYAENMLGLLTGDSGNFTGSRMHFNKALTMSRQIADTQAMIYNISNIGRSYSEQGDGEKALSFCLDALRLAEVIKNDRQIAMIATNLSATFLNESDFIKGFQYASLAKNAAERCHSDDDLAAALTHLGFISLLRDKDTSACVDLFNRALAIYHKMKNPFREAYLISTLAQTEYPDQDKVLEKLITAQKIYDKVGPTATEAAENLADIARAYKSKADAPSNKDRKNQLDLAARYLDRAIAITAANNAIQELAVLNERGASLEADRGNFQEAYRRSQFYQRINDSLFSQEKKNELAGIQGKYDLELKDKQIALGKAELSTQRRTQWALVSGLLLLSVIGVLLYRLARQRQKSNTTLLTLNTQLDEANKVKARFFGILSHDLRGPISNLLGFLHLVKEEPDSISLPEQSKHRQQISRSAEELLETMESMLLWSKEQMDEFKPNIVLVPVSDLFAYLEKFFGSDQRAQIRFNNPQQLSVSADENYLRVIMQNLTSNALKALGNSPGGLIEWSAKKVGDKTVLSISDNGPGIHPEQAKALFSDSPALNARAGFGLHLIRDLTKAIRYTISVDAAPGKGTTFHLVG